MIRRLDEGAPDIVVSDNAEFEGDAAFHRVAHGGRNARIGHRHDDVRGHRGFTRELRPDPLAGVIDRHALHHRIGTGEIDVFEDAEPFARPAEGLDAVHALVVDHDDLTGFDVAHEIGADDIQRAGFRGQDPAAGPLRPDSTQDQGADAEGVSHAHQCLVRQGDQRIGAHHLFQRVDQTVHDGGIQADGDQMDENLRIGGGLEQASAPHQGPVQHMGVGQVAVMRHREATELEIRVQRLDVAQDGVAGGGVAVVADGDGTAQGRHDPGIAEIVANEAHALVRVEALAVVADDAGRLLAAVLQGVQAQGGDGGRVRHIPDTEDAAFLMQRIVAVRGEGHA